MAGALFDVNVIVVVVLRMLFYIYCSHLQWIQNIYQNIKLNAICFFYATFYKCHTNFRFEANKSLDMDDLRGFLLKPLARYFLTVAVVVIGAFLTVYFIFSFFFYFILHIIFILHSFISIVPKKERKKTILNI